MGISMATLRRMRREFDATLGGLIDWESFSVDQVRVAVASRVGGEIIICACHWEERGYFGLTLGCTTQQGRRWLVLYEQDADAEHQLVIVLHELMHVALGHCSADQSSGEVRRELARIGMVPDPSARIVYARVCMPGAHREADPRGEERAAEFAATLIVTRAKRAGTLPPAGKTIGTEQLAISSFLGWDAETN